MFDRVVCVNLDRRPERWERFSKQFPAYWPFAYPERFSAVDGQQTGKPDWFPASHGAWGCLQSHLRIWEESLNAGHDAVLVFEDDAVCCRDFVQQLVDFLAAVPNDWDMLYPGGQHLFTSDLPPQFVDQTCRVVRGHYINRTHCYAIRGRMMRAAYDDLQTPPTHPARENDYHVDHRLCKMHWSGNWNIYAPQRFIVGQEAGRSDVVLNHRARPCQWWNQFPIADPTTEAAA